MVIDAVKFKNANLIKQCQTRPENERIKWKPRIHVCFSPASREGCDCSFFSKQGTIIEGSLEVKLPKIWRDGKAEVGSVREEKLRDGQDQRGRKSEERRCRCAKR